MLECLTRNRGGCGFGFEHHPRHCLEEDPLTNPCLVLGQPGKTRPDIAEKFVN